MGNSERVFGSLASLHGREAVFGLGAVLVCVLWFEIVKFLRTASRN